MSVSRLLTDDATVTVYDGRELLGIIVDRRDGCEAADASRRRLGKFRNWRDASTAIHEARHCGSAEAKHVSHLRDSEVSP